ncbi:hypothetical protein AVEN_96457-1, partial [Araneus ventricosus]
KKSSTRKQKDFFSLHQILNTTFATTLSDEKVKNENIINQDIVNMVSGLNVFNNQIIDMKEVNRVSWLCPKIDVKRDESEETPTRAVDVEKFEGTLEEECSEAKTSSDNDDENSDDDTHEETKETSECLAVEAEDILEHPTTGARTNQSADNEEMNPDNINKLNLVQDSSSSERSVDNLHEGSNDILQNTTPEESELLSSEMVDLINNSQHSVQTLSEVISADQETSVDNSQSSTAPRKEKLSLFKRIFKRKKSDVMKINQK